MTDRVDVRYYQHGNRTTFAVDVYGHIFEADYPDRDAAEQAAHRFLHRHGLSEAQTIVHHATVIAEKP